MIVTGLLLSCNSSDDESTTQESNFYGLTVGNTWTYRYYQKNDNTGQFEDKGIVDHVEITGTETINNEIYYVYTITTTGNDTNSALYPSNGVMTQYLREENGALVDEQGDIIYVNNDYNEIAIGAITESIIEYMQLQEGTVNITTEAGTFNTLEAKHFARGEDGTVFPGESHYYYSRGVGLISYKISWVTQPDHFIEKRLDAYSVE